MSNKGFGAKVRKNPLLLILIAVLITLGLFIGSTIFNSIQEKSREEKEKTTELTEITTVPQTEVQEFSFGSDVKKYADGIKSVSFDKEESRVAVNVTFESEEALLKANFAENKNDINAVPVFFFLVNNNSQQVKCFGEMKLSPEAKTVTYYLSKISDYANAVGLTDAVTVTLDNVLESGFNLCVVKEDSPFEVIDILGTLEKTYDGINAYEKNSVKATTLAKGVKVVDATVTDEFIWLDVYFTDVDSFLKLNNDFVNNFVNFKLEKDGISYEADFIVTEYENVNMVRCKFDSYSLELLAKKMGMENKLTVQTLFTDYKISVWTSDYDVKNNLFSLNY